MDIEKVREFWDIRPCNVRHSQFDPRTKTYSCEVTARRYFVEPHIVDFAQFDKWHGKKVLEIGCGIGTDAIAFASAGAKLTASELSEKSLDICRERFKAHGLDGTFYCGDAEHLETILPLEAFDLIYSYCFKNVLTLLGKQAFEHPRQA